MNRKAGLVLSAVILGTLAGIAPAAKAQTQAINFTSVTNDFTNGAWSLGWRFSTNSAVTVTDLGFYDNLGNGLSERHEVGLYDDVGNLLASTVVSTADPLDVFFRYHSITPLALAAGQTYRIAAETGSETYTWDPNGFTVDPNINFIENRFLLSGSLAFPTNTTSSATNAYFGPNMKLAGSSVVPEGSSLSMLFAGGAPLAFFGLRRARSRK